MRRRCPVAHDEFIGLLRLQKRRRTARTRPPRKSTPTSSPPATSPSPTAWTPPEHTTFRAVNDNYFTPNASKSSAPFIRDAVKTLIAELPRGEEVDVMQGFGRTYAMRVQNAFMGWPACLEQPLTEWIEKNRVATPAPRPRRNR